MLLVSADVPVPPLRLRVTAGVGNGNGPVSRRNVKSHISKHLLRNQVISAGLGGYLMYMALD